MDLTAANLTLKEAQEFLALNGLDRSLAWLKARVYVGVIPSHREFNSRVVRKDDLVKLLRETRLKQQGLA